MKFLFQTLLVLLCWSSSLMADEFFDDANLTLSVIEDMDRDLNRFHEKDTEEKGASAISH